MLRKREEQARKDAETSSREKGLQLQVGHGVASRRDRSMIFSRVLGRISYRYRSVRVCFRVLPVSSRKNKGESIQRRKS